MTISNQTLCFEARRKCGVGFIHTQLASSHANATQKLASSPSTVGFITRDFHALISRQHSQTNRCGLYTLFLTSKSRCMQKIKSVDALFTTQNVLSWSGRFGGGHTGWSQLQLASSVSPLWSRGMAFNTWGPKKNGPYFANNKLKCTFLADFLFLFVFSLHLKFFPKGSNWVQLTTRQHWFRWLLPSDTI